jgi:hypothetical protein
MANEQKQLINLPVIATTFQPKTHILHKFQYKNTTNFKHNGINGTLSLLSTIF